MQTVRKTQRKGSRSTQNIKRFKQTEQKMTLFEMFERFMAFKQTDGLAKPTIQGYYEHFHYLNDYLGGDVPNEEVTVELFRNYIGYMLNDQVLKPTTAKTKRSRSVPISTKTIKLLEEYMREPDDFGSEYLFVSYDGREILSNTWRRRLTELGEMAGISNKRVSPNTFIHTGALFYIMNGGDPFSLQKILGHSDMSMIRKYI